MVGPLSCWHASEKGFTKARTDKRDPIAMVIFPTMKVGGKGC